MSQDSRENDIFPCVFLFSRAFHGQSPRCFGRTKSTICNHTVHRQCHLLKQISVKKQKSAFLLPLTQIFLGSILKKLDIEKKMCGVFLIKIRKTPINQEI